MGLIGEWGYHDAQIGVRNADEDLDTEVFEFRSKLMQGEVLTAHFILLAPQRKPPTAWLQKTTGMQPYLNLVHALGVSEPALTGGLFESQCYSDGNDEVTSLWPLACTAEDQTRLDTGAATADEVDIFGVVFTLRLLLQVPVSVLGTPVLLQLSLDTRPRRSTVNVAGALASFSNRQGSGHNHAEDALEFPEPPLELVLDAPRGSAAYGSRSNEDSHQTSIMAALSSSVPTGPARSSLTIARTSALAVDRPLAVHVAHTCRGVYCEFENVADARLRVLAVHVGACTEETEWIMDSGDVISVLVPECEAVGLREESHNIHVGARWVPYAGGQDPTWSRLATFIPPTSRPPLRVTFTKTRQEVSEDSGMLDVCGTLTVRNDESEAVDLTLRVALEFSDAETDVAPLLLPLSLEENLGRIEPRMSQSAALRLASLSCGLQSLPPLLLTDNLSARQFVVKGIKCVS